MIDWNKPVQTFDGRKVRVICTDFLSVDYPVILAVSSDNGGEWLWTATLDGRKYIKAVQFFVNVPERTTIWRNCYPDKRIGVIQLSKEDVDRISSTDRQSVLEFIYDDNILIEVKIHPKEVK